MTRLSGRAAVEAFSLNEMQGYTLNSTRQWYPGTSSYAEPTTYIRTLLFLLPPFFTAPPSVRLMKLSLFFLLLTSCAVRPPRKDKTGRGRLCCVCTNVRIKTCKKKGATDGELFFFPLRPSDVRTRREDKDVRARKRKRRPAPPTEHLFSEKAPFSRRNTLLLSQIVQIFFYHAGTRMQSRH